MVKNKKGGSGHKRLARKNVKGMQNYRTKLRKVIDKDEIYAKVIKMQGGSIAEIMCNDGVVRNLILRGKFRRRKRDNRIGPNTLVLAGLRSWEVLQPKKKPKADLLYVYKQYEAEKIQKEEELHSSLQIAASTNDEDDNIEFDRNASRIDFGDMGVIKEDLSGESSEVKPVPAHLALLGIKVKNQNVKISVPKVETKKKDTDDLLDSEEFDWDEI